MRGLFNFSRLFISAISTDNVHKNMSLGNSFSRQFPVDYDTDGDYVSHMTLSDYWLDHKYQLVRDICWQPWGAELLL